MRKLAVTLLAALLAVMTVPLLVFAAPADAAGCPAGFSLVGSYCVDVNGKVAGYMKNGSYVARAANNAPVVAAPQPLNKPSSVLAAANGTGGTANANSIRAKLNGFATKVNLASKIGVAAQVVQAGNLGYHIGKGLAQMGCDWGVDVLCYPKKDPNRPANSDVQATASAGFDGPQSLTIPAGTGLLPRAQTITLSPSPEVTFGTADPAFKMLAQFTPNTACSLSDYQSFYFYAAWQTTAGTEIGNNAIGTNGSANQCQYLFDRIGWITGNVGGTSTLNGYPANGAKFVINYQLKSGSTVLANLTWTYRPKNAPGRAAPVAANPTRQLVTINTCSDGASKSSPLSAAFTETDASFPSYPVAPACTSPAALVKVEVFEKSSGLADKLIWSMNVPQAVSDWASGVGNWAGSAATCGPNGGEGCVLGLKRVGGTNPGDCFTDLSRCQGWFYSSTRDSDYQCTYGPTAMPKNVDIRECYVYSVTFEPAYRAKGQDYGDPADGTPPSAVGDDGTDGTSGNGGGNQSDDSGDPSCYPSGWSVFNPVEWIVRPIVCVLKFLFIPSDDAFSGFADGLSGAFSGSSLGKWGSALSGVGSLTGIASNGCGGATLSVPDLGPLHTAKSYSVLGTCDAPWSTISAVVKALITLTLAWATIMACYRIIASAFGMELPAKVSA